MQWSGQDEKPMLAHLYDKFAQHFCAPARLIHCTGIHAHSERQKTWLCKVKHRASSSCKMQTEQSVPYPAKRYNYRVRTFKPVSAADNF